MSTFGGSSTGPERNFICSWINDGNEISEIDILFYQSRYIEPLQGIYSKDNFKNIIKPCDILILEEPEHLLTFQPLTFFNFNHKVKFKVVGIIHTNYGYYLSRMVPQFLSKISSNSLSIFNNFIIKKNCETSIRLSAAVPNYTNSVICNVNGVPERYFKRIPQVDLQNKAYFVGKLIWEKGLKELVDLCQEASLHELDIYGDGKNRQDIIAYSNTKGLNFSFLGVLHSSSEKTLAKYKIFINPSVSEVICTTTSEALAMGKFVIIPKHVSNEFFYSFSNCLTYENSADFKRILSYTLNNQPNLNDESLAELSWHRANHRLLQIIDPK